MTTQRQDTDHSHETGKAGWVKPEVTRLEVGEAEGVDGPGADGTQNDS